MKVLLVIGAIVAALAAAGTAGADADNGAIVVNLSGCNPSPFALVCYDVKSTTNVTTTPSGNRSYVTNGVNEVSYTNPFSGCSFSQSQPMHVHWLTKDEELQSRSERSTFTNAIQCAGVSQTCVMSAELHYANGDVQFNRPEVVCTNP